MIAALATTHAHTQYITNFIIGNTIFMIFYQDNVCNQSSLTSSDTYHDA